ncbi:hypothetical protein LguiA_011041 [Lonicera macranthoides]
MDSDFKPTLSEAHPDTMDLLSHAWCNFAVNEALQPEVQDRSIVLQDYPIKTIDNEPKNIFFKMDTSVKMENPEKSIPPWKSNDVKSWIWMQQAMHPELNYNSCFRKKWLPWKIVPIKHISIKKWWKEIKQKRKEEQRLQRAEVHAAISVAGVAAALAAMAAENSKHDESATTKEAAVASAATLVAAQCAKVAEAMGAKREQLSAVMGSAMSGGTTTSDILTLTAAATTSLRGASTLKTRVCKKSRFSGSAPVLPLENSDLDFDLEKCRAILAKGSELNVETADGSFMVRSVAVVLNNEAKVLLKIRKVNLLNAFSSKMESVVLDQHTELYKDSDYEENNTCFLIVLTTNCGIIKLDMMDDYKLYKMWATTIDHILALSTSFTKYELKFYKS